MLTGKCVQIHKYRYKTSVKFSSSVLNLEMSRDLWVRWLIDSEFRSICNEFPIRGKRTSTVFADLNNMKLLFMWIWRRISNVMNTIIWLVERAYYNSNVWGETLNLIFTSNEYSDFRYTLPTRPDLGRTTVRFHVIYFRFTN